MRILAIDPGEKNIGIAISDPDGTIANPLAIIRHLSRSIDAATIASLAADHDVVQIIVGQALGDDNQPTPQSRRAARLAAAIRSQTALPVELWDESGSTQAVRAGLVAVNTSRRKRSGHHDDLAAAFILQSYLDARSPSGVY